MIIPLYNLKYERFYEDTVKTLIYFHENLIIDRVKCIPTQLIDIQNIIHEVYLSKEVSTLYVEFLSKVGKLQQNNTSEQLKVKANKLLSNFILNDIEYIIALIKSQFIHSSYFTNEALKALSKFNNDTGYNINEVEYLNYIKLFYNAESLFKSKDLQHSLNSLLIKLYTNNDFKIDNQFENTNEVENIIYLYEKEFFEMVDNNKEIPFISEPYSSDFLKRVFYRGIKLLEKDGYILKLVNKYNRWLELTKDIDGYEYRLKYKHYNILVTFINTIIRIILLEDEENTFIEINDFLMNFAIEEDIDYNELDNLLKFANERGIFDSFNLSHYSQYGRINEEKTRSILTMFQREDMNVSINDFNKVEGISKDDETRLERLEYLLSKYNETNDNNDIFTFDKFLNHFISLKVTEGTIIEVSPKYLKIKRNHKEFKYIYSCKNNQTTLSNYIKNVIPSKLPYSDINKEHLNYVLHRFIIQAFDLRRKIE